jgi:hypothetical protein
MNPQTIATAMQLPAVLTALTDALDRHGDDPAAAALDAVALRTWVEALPEVRACILLSSAYGAGGSPSPTVPDKLGPVVAEYVPEFHRYAAASPPDQAEAFHGRGFPAMPLPGQAGALASSLGFDRDDLPISLGVALVLLAASHGRAGS